MMAAVSFAMTMAVISACWNSLACYQLIVFLVANKLSNLIHTCVVKSRKPTMVYCDLMSCES